MGIALNLWIAFGKIVIFTILILPIHEHGRSFHLLRSSLISFFRDLKFLSYRSFTSLVTVTPLYFICFVTIVKGVVSLISSQSIYPLCRERPLI
jgi:multisubunit Na+/H+ antiporter MnhB subunit